MGPQYCANGKMMYDKKGAVSAKNKFWKEQHLELKVYPCPGCHTWHLTKKKKK